MDYDMWKLSTPDTEKESEKELQLFCDHCGDDIDKDVFFKGGFPVCNYCKVHILKIK